MSETDRREALSDDSAWRSGYAAGRAAGMRADDALRQAARELSDALDAPGPCDPLDGPPLTPEAVDEAWEFHGLRVDLARDALRAALTVDA